jgi:uncharacterized protein (TIGR00369 family)
MSSVASGAERLRQWLDASPFGKELGLRIIRLEPELVEMVMPYRPQLATLADVVHGGATASLLDTAATAAAWSNADPAATARGATVAMTVNYLAAARGRDLTATARVVRRGRSLCFVDVDVADTEGTLVAKGLVTYRIG